MPDYGKMMGVSPPRDTGSRAALSEPSNAQRDAKARTSPYSALTDRSAARLTARPVKRSVRR